VSKAWLMMLGLAAGLVAVNTVPAQAATLDVCPGINGVARLDHTRVARNIGLSFGGIYNQGRLPASRPG